MTESISKSYPNIIQSVGIVGFCLIVIILSIPVNHGLNKIIGYKASMLITEFLNIAIPFGVVFLSLKKRSKENSFSWSVNNKRIIPFVVLGTITLIIGIIQPLQSLIPKPDQMEKLLNNMGSQIDFWGFVLMVTVFPILEELLFRGIMLDGLLKRYSPLKSILVSSLLFGFIHLNPWDFMNVFALGLFSGWIYYKTNSVLPSILVHITMNLCAYIKTVLFDIDLINKDMVKFCGGIANFSIMILGSFFIFSICVAYLRIKAIDR